MKRDMDLVRHVLLEVEKQPFTNDWIKINPTEDYTTEQISYHVMILDEAGLLEATQVIRTHYEPTRLTWEGHEFLALAKEDSRWKKACSTMLEKGGGVALGVLKQLLTSYMMHELGIV